ncbi:hypothetical protein GCK72_016591 [Caenorhabditis remanei]|uniref:Uncharacterized protein n=1 Tax=Caenorhabditis remanei TaxID=31234 RepID=A0A6A5G596_CAERE|nr:hypothetical protein GCK72_016591 [Caenorhabditis remanei]KAF1750046.1 hypothetical protein GCK72_016591 [Caenorhabditis remanei]
MRILHEKSTIRSRSSQIDGISTKSRQRGAFYKIPVIPQLGSEFFTQKMNFQRLKTLTNVSPMKRKRTASSVDHLKPEDVKPMLVPKIDPVKKRTARMTAKATGPEFDDDE